MNPALTPDEVLERLRKPIKVDPWKRDELFAGRPGSERMDCVVRAFTVATGLPYAAMHAMFKAAGRKDGRKTRRSVTEKVAKRLGMVWVDRRCHVATLLNEKRDYTVAAFIAGHAFAVGQGAVLDIEPVRPRQRVKGFFALPR